MATKPIERLLFAQGGNCFFCENPLPRSHASVEHLVALTFGGKDGDENCVACCKSLNNLFGRMSLKEKLKIILHQKGLFVCPAGIGKEPLNENSDAPVLDQENKISPSAKTSTEFGEALETSNLSQENVVFPPPFLSAVEIGLQKAFDALAQSTSAKPAAPKTPAVKKKPSSTADTQATPAKTPAKKTPTKNSPQKKALNAKQKVNLAVEILRKHGNKKPATIKSLENTLRSQLSQAGVIVESASALIAELAARSYIRTTENKVEYALPAKNKNLTKTA